MKTRSAALVLVPALALACSTAATTAFAAGGHRGAAARTTHPRQYKLDDELVRRAAQTPGGTTRVIVTLQPGAQLPPALQWFSHSGKLRIINGHVVALPNRLLNQLAADPAVFRIHYDRPTRTSNFLTSLTTGARGVQQLLGLTGSGVGVAVIDSGIASHDDLAATSAMTAGIGGQRVRAFVDFVNGQLQPYDDNGHGTHVAGIIAGNGYDSGGLKAGAAPDADLVSLKVLDANGQGNISHIIAALDWVVANKDTYNIRVVNLSAGAAVRESYLTDPLTLAAKRAVDAGIVVVTAAGNLGRSADGSEQYGGITAPGNAPWVITVGASSTMGTPAREDDTVATYSSRGPTYLDWSAKPDLVAPGTGTVSLAAPGSTLYATKSEYLQAGVMSTPFLPYLSLTGTSMAAPVVSGTVALMLQANPALTPNAVKAILEYTAQIYSGYDPLTQGVGFLNSLGAVRLARFYATARTGDVVPVQDMWSKHVLWGNHLLSGGVIVPGANAWGTAVTWGATQSDSGDNIVWGSACSDSCDNIVWGSSGVDNIVWGSLSRDNIVWGSGGDDNIVWGSDCGGGDCDNIVWGSVDGDNIVWGSVSREANIVWGSLGLDADNIVWGSVAGSASFTLWTDTTSGQIWTSGMGDLPRWVTDEKVFAALAPVAASGDPGAAPPPPPPLPALTLPTATDTTNNVTVVAPTAAATDTTAPTTVTTPATPTTATPTGATTLPSTSLPTASVAGGGL
jgi:serine protease AprX